ncbi:unnamed protein product [Camellia sinensis]
MRKRKSRSSRRRSRKSESVGDSELDELSEDIHDGLQDEPWEERTLHLLYNSKINQDFSIAKVQKSGRKKHKVRWMSKRAMAIPQVIIELQDQALRESTLRSQYFPSRVTEEVVNEGEKNVAFEKPAGEEEATDVNKENPANEAAEEKEPEEKEMTLEEYEKVLEEKRKALLALKTEEMKVAVDKELASTQQLSSKKDNNDIFGSDKDKRKELAENEEKSKKFVSINEFLKPAGDRYYNSGTRGRGGRGRDSRGGYAGGGDSRGGYGGVGAK